MKLPNIPLVQNSRILSEAILPSEFIELKMNPDQKDYLVNLKIYYLIKIGSLLAVLTGYKRTTFIQEFLDIDYTDYLDKYLEVQLYFYELIKYSWRDIKHIFADYSVETPFEAIVQIYHFEAVHSFAQCFAVDSRIYPATIYREYNSLTLIVNKQISNEALTKKERKLVAKVKKRYQADETKELLVHLYLIEQCEAVWSRSKESSICSRFKIYKQEREFLGDDTKKPFHPRFNPAPIGWINGLLL
jgi:hypothetical protein